VRLPRKAAANVARKLADLGVDPGSAQERLQSQDGLRVTAPRHVAPDDFERVFGALRRAVRALGSERLIRDPLL
jgi:hypothetical protein